MSLCSPPSHRQGSCTICPDLGRFINSGEEVRNSVYYLAPWQGTAAPSLPGPVGLRPDFHKLTLF